MAPSAAAAWLGAFEVPKELVARVALGLGVLLLLVGTFRKTPLSLGLTRSQARVGWFFAAAFASLAYVSHYLHAGPRIIDATTYLAQARALAEGSFTASIPMPSASFRGRFFLFTPDRHIGGIFPPGYPLLLSLGVRLGAPMVIGPLLAGAIAVVTQWLATECLRNEPLAERDKATLAQAASAFSLVSAALRYHTADTMSHGLVALASAVCLASAMRGRAEPKARWIVMSGLALSVIVCTRPLSAAPPLLGVFLLQRHLRSPRAALGLGFAMLPGVGFLLAQQHALTGHAFASPQKLYYAVSDGPADCFRYGFGQGIGCVFEHEDFVRTRLSQGFGAKAAVITTLSRLRHHLTDIDNAEPLVVLVIIGLRKSPWARALAWVLAAQVLVYAPFYFDGNYPGGGARFFADVLPLEHALLVVGLGRLRPSLAAHRKVALALGVSLVGFAVHAAPAHAQLAARDGGAPMFDPQVLSQAKIDKGLVFVSTDHGFNLAFDPRMDPKQGIVAARRRSDARDRLLYDLLGAPPTYLYTFDPLPGSGTKGAEAKVEPFVPPAVEVGEAGSYRFEAEAEWPPLAQNGGYATPHWRGAGCASQGRVLMVAPTSEIAVVDIELPAPRAAKYRIRAEAFAEGPAELELRIVEAPGFRMVIPMRSAGCHTTPAELIDLKGPSTLRLTVRGAPAALDAIVLDR
jgi:hypothetical protein